VPFVANLKSQESQKHHKVRITTYNTFRYTIIF